MSFTATRADSPPRFFVAAYTVTLVTSATLLFWVQPMIAKFILPSVGGAPAVWNTAMMFFQAALLVGYLYAHVLSRRASHRGQVLIHLGLLLCALAWLPIGIATDTLPPANENPSLWVLGVLALSIGVPFIVIAGSAPLLQTWFAKSTHQDADNPYFLYAASNVGSLAALFGYPLIAEPLLDLDGQSWAWSLGFMALVVLTALTAAMSRSVASAPLHRHDSHVDAPQPPSTMDKVLWTAIMLVSTSLMLGVTTHITTDVAAVPLLWVLPLALYLLTFVIVFARRERVSPDGALVALVVGLVLFAGLWMLDIATTHWLLWAGALLALFFLFALALHGELARLKPHKHWLTQFYLWMAVGGVLGGMFNALLAPVLFTNTTEFALMIGLAVALILGTRAHARGESAKPMAVLATLCILAPVIADRTGLLTPENMIHRERNFFGVLSVVQDQDLGVRALKYGTTAHGMRDLRPGHELEPVGYYGRTSPLGDVMAEILPRPKSGDVAAIGLGVGSIACYPLAERKLMVYEINPAVTRLAEHPSYFNFLKGCGQDYRVVHGDGRLKIQEAAPGAFDLIFLDAFTSDSIPVHLLTREAMALYVEKLSETGMVLAHISNNHLDLAPVLGSIAQDLGLVAVERVRTRPLGDAQTRLIHAKAHMVALARTKEDLGSLATDPRWRPLQAPHNLRTWTDGYTNVIGTLKVFKP